MLNYLLIRIVAVPEFKKVVAKVCQGESRYLSTYEINELEIECVRYPYAENFLIDETPDEFFDILNGLEINHLVIPLTESDIIPGNIIEFMNRIVCRRIMIVDYELNVYSENREDSSTLLDRFSNNGKPVAERMPAYVNISISSHCNLRCRMCGHREAEQPVFLDYDTILKRIDFLGSTAKVLSFSDFGELFLHPRVNDVLNYVAETFPRVKINIGTNGIMMPDRNVFRKLLALDMIRSLNISVNAASQKTYQLINGRDRFNPVIENSRQYAAICSEFPDSAAGLAISYVAQRDNLEEMPEIVDIASHSGIGRVILRPVLMGKIYNFNLDAGFEAVDSEQAIFQSTYFHQDLANAAYLETAARGRQAEVAVYHPTLFGDKTEPTAGGDCQLPWTHVEINTRGKITICCYYPFQFGNIDRGDFVNSWNGPDLKELRRTVNRRPGNPHCSRCVMYGDIDINSPHYHFGDEIIEKFNIR